MQDYQYQRSYVKYKKTPTCGIPSTASGQNPRDQLRVAIDEQKQGEGGYSDRTCLIKYLLGVGHLVMLAIRSFHFAQKGFEPGKT